MVPTFGGSFIRTFYKKAKSAMNYMNDVQVPKLQSLEWVGN